MTSPHPPLLAILFFLAMVNAPKDAHDIQVTAPHFSAHWRMTPEGWRGGQDHAKDVWSIKNNKSIVVGGVQEHDKSSSTDKSDKSLLSGLEEPDDEENVDVATFIKPALNHDWSRNSKVKLSADKYVEKTNVGLYTAL